MDIKTLLMETHRILTQAYVDHALIGGMALGFHGVQRFTNDVDYLVAGSDASKVKQAFVRNGFSPFHEGAEVLQFQGLGNVDFLLANRDLSKKMLAAAPPIPKIGIKCIGVEDIIGLKIQAYVNAPKRELQDKADIQALVTANPKLDWKKIKIYADGFGEWDAIVAIRERAHE